MVKITKSESDVLKCLLRWRKEYNNYPGIADIAAETHRSYTVVYMAIMNLNQKGYIEIVKVRRRWIIKDVLAYE